MRVNDIFFGQEHRTFNRVFKFAHIARPRVAHEHFNRTASKATHILTHQAAVMIHKVIRQKHNVGAALAKRRYVNRNDVKLVVQIFAESSIRDHLLQILSGRANHAHVHLFRESSTNTFHFALLQKAKQFYLQIRREFSNFIEE